LIEAKNLTKKFGNQLVFENLNFQIHQGDFISLIGPNGSGKTTLVKILMGLEKKTSGQLNINKKEAIGYVPQFRNIDLDYPLSIEQFVRLNLKFTASLKKRRQDNQKLSEILEKTGLTKLHNRPLGLSSGGEKQKSLSGSSIIEWSPDFNF
jgi:ABC-type Mn/Zn transport systems, ATPase component